MYRESFLPLFTDLKVSRRVVWLISLSGRRGLCFPLDSADISWQSYLSPNKVRWIFRSKSGAKALWSRLNSYGLWLRRIFFLKFRLRGLGYRFRRITSGLYRFYFTRTNYIYFHRPKNLYLFSRKRRVIILSPDRQLLHSAFRSIVGLQRRSPYNRRGFAYARRISRRKPGKKIL